jgi:flagellar transcriptional activator FlhC
MAKQVLAPTEELRQLQLAKSMVGMGARIQVLQAETELSRSKLLKLYKDVTGESPPNGMLPSSEKWFLSWMQNVDSSLFLSYYTAMRNRGIEHSNALVKAYRFYQTQVDAERREGVLTFSRAWTLIRFMDAKILDTAPCQECSTMFIVHKYGENSDYHCPICRPHSKALPAKKIQAECA